MTDPSRPPDAGTRPERESNTSLSRWLYLTGVVTAILILVAVALQFTGGGLGDHRPPPHAAPGDAGSHTHPSGDKNHTQPSEDKKGHAPPAGFHGHVPPDGAHK